MITYPVQVVLSAYEEHGEGCYIDTGMTIKLFSGIINPFVVNWLVTGAHHMLGMYFNTILLLACC